MIERLLRLVGEAGAQSYQDLANRLAISLPLLAAMLEELARLGYLRSVDGACGGHCGGCSMGGCSVSGSGRLWTLTAKGARAAAQ